MSLDNVEILREALAAFNRGDLDAFVQVGHPDVAFRTSGRLPDVPSSVNGTEGARAWCEALLSAFDVEIDASQFVEAGDTVAATVRMVARGKSSGLSLDNTFTFVWHLRDGLVTVFDVYASRSEALEAAGLRE